MVEHRPVKPAAAGSSPVVTASRQSLLHVGKVPVQQRAAAGKPPLAELEADRGSEDRSTGRHRNGTHGRVAQRYERCPDKAEALGSIPSATTRNTSADSLKDRVPDYESGGCGFKSRSARLGLVSSAVRAPPPHGGRRGFKSLTGHAVLMVGFAVAGRRRAVNPARPVRLRYLTPRQVARVVKGIRL